MTVLQDVIRPGTRRGLDFVVLEELRKRTGIMPNEVLKFAMAEMLCNALDTDATRLEVNIATEADFIKLSVSDNSQKRLSYGDVKLILNFENKASSKRGFLRVSRGYLGNALKCIFGYGYALAEESSLPPPDIIIESGPNRYSVALKPDRVKETIKSEILATKRKDTEYTTFTVMLPTNSQLCSPSALKDIVFATSLVNPTRQISLHIKNSDATENCSFGYGEKATQIRQETSVLWYTAKQFETLFNDFLRARPETQLKEFIALFRGFTGKNVIREILQDFNASNHDSESVQFFPATPIRDISPKRVPELFSLMRLKAKTVSKRSIASVLGCIGEKAFEQVRERQEWKRLRYIVIPAFRVECADTCQVEFPYLIELAVFDRHDDGEGLKVYQCVNFMASMEDIFSRIFDIKYRLGRVGITKDMPVTVLTHLVCPVLKWLNYGKSGLDE
jgi:hypothetical protein